MSAKPQTGCRRHLLFDEQKSGREGGVWVDAGKLEAGVAQKA